MFFRQSLRDKPISRSDVERLSLYLHLDYEKHFHRLHNGLAHFIDGDVHYDGIDYYDHLFIVDKEWVRLGKERKFWSCTCNDWRTDDRILKQKGCPFSSQLQCAHIIAAKLWRDEYEAKPVQKKDGREVKINGMTCIICTRSIEGVAYIEVQQVITDNRAKAEAKLAQMGWVLSDNADWIDIAKLMTNG